MAYKTILVHADQSRHAAARIRIAAQIAMQENAHLIGAAMTGVSRFIYEQNEVDLARTVLANHVDALYQRAEDALVQFDRIVAEAGLQSHERRLINDDDHGGLCLQARYCDLVVLGQVDIDDAPTRTMADLPEYVVMNSARPVLIVPYAASTTTVGEQALLAWDGSIESTRAVTNAVPMLRHAKKVTVVLFNPSGDADTRGDQPGDDIALFLARHGIRAEVMRQAASTDVGSALLSLTAEMQSDLLVMGGYGHTRFREVLLGGVTRTVLASMTVPVLMSH